VRKDSCVRGARRSSELGSNWVRMRKKMHPSNGRHTKCQSFIESMSLKMCVADRIPHAAGAKKFRFYGTLFPDDGARLTA